VETNDKRCNMKIKTLDEVRTLAKIEARDTRCDQVIISTYFGTYKGFRFLPANKFDGRIIEYVRYTPEDQRGEVLRDNDDGESGIAESKPKRKRKRRKAE
jgi:hypothetical protein